MSLHVRLFVNYWEHRKTLALIRLLGPDGALIPIKLWCYAAANQPNGDFTSYAPVDLAHVVRCEGDPAAMVEALQSCGFLDGMKLHDWEEHNGYHHLYANRGRYAAEARWKKEKKQKKEIHVQKEKGKGKGSKQCSSNAQALLQASEIYSAYPLKVGKPDALRAIKKALENTDSVYLLGKTKQYALVRGSDLAFVPHPATWFNQHRYEDDPETWKPKNNGSAPKGQEKIADVNQARWETQYAERRAKRLQEKQLQQNQEEA